jgi:hypothetical protein
VNLGGVAVEIVTSLDETPKLLRATASEVVVIADPKAD